MRTIAKPNIQFETKYEFKFKYVYIKLCITFKYFNSMYVKLQTI